MDLAPPPSKKQRLSVADLLATPVPSSTVRDEPDLPLLTTDHSWSAAKKITSQMRSGAIPLTILTGFLGAGKSTILNYILRAPHKLRIAVLINEFGAVDIDSQLVDTSTTFQNDEPVVLDNGCICCTISNGFINALSRIINVGTESGTRPDYIIVETTGLADPKPILSSVEQTELCDSVYVDQVITAVDSSAWTSEHYNSPTAKLQIESADTVLLTKMDLVKSQASLQSVINSIISIRPNARILRSQSGQVPLAALFDIEVVEENKVSNTDAEGKTNDGHQPAHVNSMTSCANPAQSNLAPTFRGANSHEDHLHEWRDNSADKGVSSPSEPKNVSNGDVEHSLASNKDAHGCRPCHGHGSDECCDHRHKEKKSHFVQEGFTSVSFVSKQPLSLSRFRKDFVDKLPEGVFRAKGLLWFHNYSSRFTFHWSGSRFDVVEEDWPENVETKNQLVVIGRSLDHDEVTAMFNSCIIQPGEEDLVSTDEEHEDGDEEDEDGGEGGEGDDEEDDYSDAADGLRNAENAGIFVRRDND